MMWLLFRCSFAAFGEGMDPVLFGDGPQPIGGRKANLSDEIQAWAEEASSAHRCGALSFEGLCWGWRQGAHGVGLHVVPVQPQPAAF